MHETEYTAVKDNVSKVTITASVVGGDGRISPSGEIKYHTGENPRYIFPPNRGYEIEQVLIDGKSVPAANGSYTFSNLKANHTITVSFKSVSVPTPGASVVINGVRWATCNVDKPGTFVASPENEGMFYQWNSIIGWSSNNPLVNSDGGTVWTNSSIDGRTWAATNDPSPTGWRLPTRDEIHTLNDESKIAREWYTLNGINGYLYTEKRTGKTLFLPAAGYRDRNTGKLNDPGTSGYYWSSTENDPSVYALGLYFYNGNSTAYKNSLYRTNGQSVRCVAK